MTVGQFFLEDMYKMALLRVQNTSDHKWYGIAYNLTPVPSCVAVIMQPGQWLFTSKTNFEHFDTPEYCIVRADELGFEIFFVE